MKQKEEIEDIWITCSVSGTRSVRIHTGPGHSVTEILELLRAGAAQVDIDSIHTEVEGRHVRLARIVDVTEEVVSEDWRKGQGEHLLRQSRHEG